VYFIRTNLPTTQEKLLWEIYNCIREVEATFRCLKTDLQIRPVYHQKDSRIESHIYLTILAYQLVNTIRHMLKQSGIHYDWNNIMRIMSTQIAQTTVIPTDKKVIHLRKVSVPARKVREIYKACACEMTTKAKKKFVVYH
jgi:transposase